MRRAWLVVGICGMSVILAAEPVCKRLSWHVPLPHRAAKKLDHKPTAKTLAGWKAWDAARTLREYDLACGPAATLDASVDGVLQPVEVPPWTEEAVDIPVVLLSGSLYSSSGVEDISDVTPPQFIYLSAPPPVTTVTAETPEPASIWLMLAGLSFAMLLVKKPIPTYSQPAQK